MSDSAQTLEPFLQRREKNLAFFEKNYHELYKLLKNHKLKHIQVNIMPEAGEVDLIKDGKLVYNGAKSYAAKEMDVFTEAYGPGKRICSFVPPFYGDYDFPRYGHQHVNALLEKSPVRAENFRFYPLEDFYPMIVFLGVGLGYHIEKMVKEKDIHHVVLVEPDIDRMAASLYAVDWEEITGRYNAPDGRSFHFIVGAQEEEYLIWAATWNRVIELCPHFPVTTLFYNHQGTELFDRISDKVNKDLIVFLMSWGHYDDEIRQMNNALHNFNLGIKELPKEMKPHSHTPVFIVGAGPSLNDRLPLLKEMKDQAIIISCGTSLRTLASHGVEPDIHVELESDLLAYIALSQAADEEYLSKLKIIAPSHVSPLIFALGQDARMYYKAESTIAQMFGSETGHIILNATPTCTVAALAISVALGFRKLFLFGLDFGFKDKKEHHAKGSIYYENIMPLDYDNGELFSIDAVGGGKAYSTPNYFTSKRKVENLIKSYCLDKGLEVFSCSDVAQIEETTWLDDDAFRAKMAELPNDKERDMDYIFSGDATTNSLTHVESKLRYVEENLKALSHDIDTILSGELNTLADMSLMTSKVNWYLESVLKTKTPDFYFFIRGAIRHYLCAGLAHTFSIGDADQRLEYMQNWKEAFSGCFRDKPEHYRKTVFKDFDLDTDPWIKQSSLDAEDAVNPFFTEKIEDLRYEW